MTSHPPTSASSTAPMSLSHRARAPERQLVEKRADEAMAACEGHVAVVRIASKQIGRGRPVLCGKRRRDCAAGIRQVARNRVRSIQRHAVREPLVELETQPIVARPADRYRAS